MNKHLEKIKYDAIDQMILVKIRESSKIVLGAIHVAKCEESAEGIRLAVVAVDSLEAGIQFICSPEVANEAKLIISIYRKELP